MSSSFTPAVGSASPASSQPSQSNQPSQPSQVGQDRQPGQVNQLSQPTSQPSQSSEATDSPHAVQATRPIIPITQKDTLSTPPVPPAPSGGLFNFGSASASISTPASVSVSVTPVGASSGSLFTNPSLFSSPPPSFGFSFSKPNPSPSPFANRNFSIDPQQLTFKGPFLVPQVQTLRVTNLAASAGMMHIFGNKLGSQSSLLARYFDVQDAAMQQGYADLPIRASETIQVRFTLRPVDIDALDDLPTQLNIWIVYTNGEKTQNILPTIQYNLPRLTSDLECNQCLLLLISTFYKCIECTPDYNLCLNCTDRCGREAHISRRGLDHTFVSNAEKFKCYVCEDFTSKGYLLCHQCHYDGFTTAVMCLQCSKKMENITRHPKTKARMHNFDRFEDVPMPTLTLEPEQYEVKLDEKMVCSRCPSRLRLEFFGCIDCPEPFKVCDRCADEGALAQHPVHRFRFYVPPQP